MTEKFTLKALLLDDDPFMLLLLSEMLANQGITHVTACESGREALEWLDSPDYSVDLLFLDINMPDMDGIEFVRHLATRHYHGSVVLISGEDERMLQSAEKLVKTHNLVALGHLQKPINAQTLTNLLEKHQTSWMPPPSPVRKTYHADELKAAIANNELINYYQPQVDVKTCKVVGVEALVRWQHPTDGLVYPDQFIYLAEQNGLIGDLTKAVIKSAFAHSNLWQHHNLSLRVSVNLSMDNLASLEFVDYLIEMVTNAEISSTDIVLEITESQLMKHLSTSLEILSRLRLKRFGLSIDDFGTGYSSLSLLRTIPFNELKIDQSFVHGAAHNETLYAIYNSSLLLARQLGMKVVAEGVEDWDDWNLLRISGCDEAQGYFIAKPMPAEQLLDWTSHWNENFECFMS